MTAATGAPLDIGLPEDRIQVAVGTPTIIEVAVRNRAAVPVIVVARALGAEVDGAEPTRTEALAPGETVAVSVVMEVPARFPGNELTAAVELVVHRADDPSGEPLGRTVTPLSLVVGDAGEVTARLAKRDLRGRSRARLRLVLENRGSMPVDVGLEGDSPTGKVRVKIPDEPFTIAPGDHAVIQGKLKARPRLFGRVDSHPFAVLVSTRRGTQRISGRFSHRPLVVRGFRRFLAVVVVLAVWAGGLVIGLDRLDERRSQDDSEIAQAAGDDADGDDPAGPGDGDGDGDDPDAPGEGDEDEGPPVVQVGGTMKGSDVAGVNVRIEPVSLTDAQEQGARFASTLKSPPPVQGLTKRFGRSAPTPAMTVPSAEDARATASGVAVSAVEVGPRSTVSDPDGRWAFAGIRAPGFYLLTFSKPGFEVAKYVVEAAEGDDGISLDVELVAGDGSISGRIFGPDGQPLGGADITVTDGDLTFTTRSASTGDVGTYRLEGLSTPGSYLVAATRRGYSLESTLVSLPGRGNVGGADLRLRNGVATVTGTVTSPDGPMGGLTVMITDGETTREATTLTEGPVGTFTLPQLPIPGMYTLSVGGEGLTTETREIDLRDNTRVGLQVRSSTATLTGRVTSRTTGAGINTVGIGLDKEGEELRSTGATGGAFQLERIPPGSYVVTFTAAGFKPASVLVDLPAGSTRNVDVALDDAPPPGVERTASLLVNVIDDTDREVGVPASLTLTLAPDGEGFEEVLHAAASLAGNATFQHLPPGIHTLRAEHPEFVPFQTRLQVPAGTSVSRQIQLVPLASLTGTVQSIGGALPGAVIEVWPVGQSPDVALTETADDEGRYAFMRKFTSGTYNIRVTAPKHDVLNETVVLQAPNITDRPLTLIRRGMLDVTVYEPGATWLTIQALQGATVELVANAGTANEAVVADGLTDADGLVQLDDLDAGHRLVRISKAGYFDGSFTVDIVKNLANPQTGARVLGKKQGNFTGQVNWMRNNVAQPVPSPSVEVTVLDAQTIEQSGAVTTSTSVHQHVGNSTGAFTFDMEAAGAISPIVDVELSHADFFPLEVLQWSSTQTLTRNLTPRPGIVTGFVQSVTGALVVPQGTVTGTVIQKPAEAGNVTVELDDPVGQFQFYRLHDTAYPNEDGVRPGSYVIQFTRPGFESGTTATINVLPNRSHSVPLVQLHQFSRIRLTTQSSSTDPAPNNVQTLTGATVTLSRLVGNDWVEVTERTLGPSTSTTTFNDLPRATYRIEVDKADPNLVPFQNPFQATINTAGTDLTPTVYMRRLATLTGTLRGQHGSRTPVPIAEAEVTLTGPDAQTTRTVSTNQSGVFAFGALEPGSYTLTSSPAGYEPLSIPETCEVGQELCPSWSGVVAAGAANSAGTHVLPATNSRLFGTVTEAGTGTPGTPLEGVEVRITVNDGQQLVELVEHTDEDGFYEFDDILALVWSASFVLENYSELRVDLDLMTTRELEYSPPLTPLRRDIFGFVFATYGEKGPLPLQGATVQLTNAGGSQILDTATSGADGRYVFPAQRSGNNFRVRFPAAQNPGYQTPADQAVSLGGKTTTPHQVDDVTMAAFLRPVHITVTSSVLDGDDDPIPIAGREVTLTADQNGTGTTVGPVTTSSSGVAQFSQVVPGAYTIDVAADPDNFRPGGDEGFTLAPGPTTPAVTGAVTISEGGITGTVTLDDGTAGPPAATGDVVISTTSGSVNAAIEDGEYFVLLGAGEYTVEYSAGNDYPEHSDTVTVAAGTSATSHDISLDKFGSLAVTVEDDEEDLVAGAVVTLRHDDADGEQVGQLTTNGANPVTFTGLAAGTYWAGATAAGHEDGAATVTVGVGEAATTTVTVDAIPPPPPPDD